jgi:hypothetical protein
MMIKAKKLFIIKTYCCIVLLWRCGPMRLMACPLLRFLDHTRDITVGRTPLDEWSARRRDLYLTKHINQKRQTCMPPPPSGWIRTRKPSKRVTADLFLWSPSNTYCHKLDYDYMLIWTASVVVGFFRCKNPQHAFLRRGS